MNLFLWIFLSFTFFWSLCLVCKTIRFFTSFRTEVRFLKMEIERADSQEEVLFYQRALWDLRLSILPFLTPNRVRAIRLRFFSRAQDTAEGSKHSAGHRILLSSLVGILLCCICFVGSTFAWFYDAQSVSAHPIRSAYYTVSAVVTQGESTLSAVNDTYALEAGKTYTVTLLAGGNASDGYATLSFGDLVWQTESFAKREGAPKDRITFTLVVTEATTMQVEAHWGVREGGLSFDVADQGTYTI